MQRAEATAEAALVDGSDLVEQNDRVGLEATLRSFDQHLGGVDLAVEFRGDGGDDGERTVAVINVVLDDDRRSCLLEFSPAGGVELDDVDVAASDDGYTLSSFCRGCPIRC